ncbi:MAG TPA: tetratricopeptide repeat protein, partial [Rhizomicrobium sp.]|nr:tetratricopeptide repeat protein [Rhizomicrobium sp.]
MDSFNRALSLRPDYIAALSNRASLLFEANRLDDAMADYQAVLAAHPDNVTALIGQGNILRQLAQTKADDERAFLVEKALDSYRFAINVAPNSAQAHYSLAMTLHRIDQLHEAIEHYRHAVRLQPRLAEAYSDMGVAQFEAGQLAEAAASLDQALAIEPGKSKFLWNKSLYLLALGEFAQGWRLYESRLSGKGKNTRGFGWLDNEDLRGKAVHVWAEQGLGDTIQFSRYVPLLKARGAMVTLHARASLTRLLSQLGREIIITSSMQEDDKGDYAIPLLSLPLAFGTRLDSIPAGVPYLHAEAEKIRDWKARLGTQGFKIGVAWRGTMATKLSAARSFPLGSLEQLSRLPGVRLISLQIGDDQASPGIALERLGGQFDAGDDAFLDAAAV